MKKCPICKNETEDMRHVSVECFYAVDEVVPEVKKEQIFTEVKKEGSYWGYTRTYPEGTRDKFITKEKQVKKGETPVTEITIKQQPVDGVRLLEKDIYSINCCKNCRADFLSVFEQWSEGNFSEDTEYNEEANIPIRENGAIRYISKAEWERMHG